MCSSSTLIELRLAQHANDYDHQRMFLGPYSGRDPDIIPHLRGVMTNPNCEYRFDVGTLNIITAEFSVLAASVWLDRNWT